ncbi:hypothetical protein DFP72DRAFT_1162657 [Ephemerocybe angulata]|uniref:Uncharacterized protein n=1 Tax=Ephemerocybe angulata TaxID=980116 RepID=A0A8H6MCY8_9AGAR|nr:hypothetical protein DFP72DRAFT_1162657 [Tulosesus angulatus]
MASLLNTVATSPALTASSYGVFSPTTRPSRSSTVSSTASSFQLAGADSDSEDEIVWSLASDSVADLGETASLNASYHSLSSDDDDDFVVLSRRGTTGLLNAATNPGSGADTPIDAAMAASNRSASSAVPGALRSRLQELTLEDTMNEAVPKSESGNTATDLVDASPAGGATGRASPIHVRPEDKVPEEAQNPGAASLPTPEVSPKRERKVGPDVASPLTQGASPVQENQVTPMVLAATKKKSKKKSKSKRRKAKDNAKAKANAEGIVDNEQAKKVKKKVKKAKKAAAAKLPGGVAPAAPVAVDPSMFKEASEYISSFLSSPEARSNAVCRLTLLQSLIVELGLISSALTLPASLKSAKSFLKTHAFLNIKEYISVRGQGQDAIRKILYPSRSALIRDIRKKRNAASLQWVKEHGLQVLLVGCFH